MEFVIFPSRAWGRVGEGTVSGFGPDTNSGLPGCKCGPQELQQLSKSREALKIEKRGYQGTDVVWTWVIQGPGRTKCTRSHKVYMAHIKPEFNLDYNKRCEQEEIAN